MKTLSVVIPVYYNAESLPLLFKKLLKIEEELVPAGIKLELIFVDDGSGDNSLLELLKIKQQRPTVQIVKLARNFGAVRASKAGLQFVNGDCYMLLAADLQDPPELIIEMAKFWLQGEKYIIAVRAKRSDPFLSRIFAAIYYRLLKSIVVRDYPQGGYDIALMDRSLLPYILQAGKNTNPQLLSYWLGIEPVKIHYDRPKREHGRSRWTFLKRLTYFLDSLLGFSVLPIRIMSLIGLVVSTVSFGLGLSIAINRLMGNIPEDAPGFAALASLLSFLLGLILVMLGLIGEYIWRIYEEVNKRPEFVIEEVY